jgi:hypothetical protein
MFHRADDRAIDGVPQIDAAARRRDVTAGFDDPDGTLPELRGGSAILQGHDVIPSPTRE